MLTPYEVDSGRNPVTQETAGIVDSESLAAESVREGGGFASNRNAQPENPSSQEPTSSSQADELSAAPNADARAVAKDTTSTNAASYDEATNSGAYRGQNMPDSYAGTAPSYISSQYAKDKNGPHGKNLTEGGDWSEGRAQEGIRQALASEPGSVNDPSRSAEHKFQNSQASTAGDAGPRQTGLTSQTKYDELSREAPA